MTAKRFIYQARNLYFQYETGDVCGRHAPGTPGQMSGRNNDSAEEIRRLIKAQFAYSLEGGVK